MLELDRKHVDAWYNLGAAGGGVTARVDDPAIAVAPAAAGAGGPSGRLFAFWTKARPPFAIAS